MLDFRDVTLVTKELVVSQARKARDVPENVSYTDGRWSLLPGMKQLVEGDATGRFSRH